MASSATHSENSSSGRFMNCRPPWPPGESPCRHPCRRTNEHLVRFLTRVCHHPLVRISVAADELTGVAADVASALGERGHEVVAAHGALNHAETDQWAW